MKNILITTDFSSSVENAVAYGIKLARLFNAKVHLLHCYHLPVAVGDAAVMLDTSEEELLEGLKTEMDNLEDKYLSSKVPSYEIYLRQGFAADEIVSLAKTENIDLIVMGTKGPAGTWEFLGNHINNLIHQTACPILVVPEKVSFKAPETILFATDFEEVVDWKVLKEFAVSCESKIDILNVDPDFAVVNGDHIGFAAKLNHDLWPVPHTYHVLREADTEKAIQQFIDKNKIDILTLVPRKHNFVERILGRSLTRKMVFHTHIPLLILQN